MEDHVKLIKGQTLDGNTFQFVIFINQPVGRNGGSGALVTKAIQKSRPYEELVVKMTALTQKNKQKVLKQIQIIRSLPDHANIIRVHPIKINSENFSYIFMEYCNQGTLQDLMRNNKGLFSQIQLFNIFYQIISGYKVLWEHKILHQDLKPNNIFIKNAKFKIADFDLSVFHEGVKFGALRQGTFPYMSPQKLTLKQYHANCKSDIYSMGIIFFKLIFQHHPYVIGYVQNLKEYIEKLKTNPVQISRLTTSIMSIQMQQFLDIILKMIIKSEIDRVCFEQILVFVESSMIFRQLRNKQLQGNKDVTEQFKLQQQKTFNIVQQSQAIFIPFLTSKQQQLEYQIQLKERIFIKKEQSYFEVYYRIQKYLISMRLIVYFFDRLSRRLHIEYLKANKQNQLNQQQKAIYERVILSIIIMAKKINEQTMQEKDTHQIFTVQQWKKYKLKKPEILKLIEKDKEYLFLLLQDNLIEKGQCQIIQKRQIIKKSESNLLYYLKEARNYLQEVLELRKVNINPQDRNSLITLVYLISSLKIIDNFQQWIERYEEIQNYFRTIQTEPSDQLLTKIIKGLGQMNLNFTLLIDEQFQQIQIL